MEERRLYSRIIFHARAKIVQANKTWTSKVIDLSLKGALFETPANWIDSEDPIYTVQFQLNDSDIKIEMELKLVNQDDRNLHFTIEHLDIDSASHLKRLVELNVGNDDLLHRELAQLVASD